MSEDWELLIQRKNTLKFINADPVSLVLTRESRIDTGDGGYKKGPPTEIAVQTFRLIPQTDPISQIQTPDGIQLITSFMLLGTHDCDMARWDEFTLNGVRMMIVGPVRPEYTVLNVYERKAEVARL